MQISRADVADLIYFMAIARHRSFSRAAIELGVSASALSHALKGLETRLGVRLLNRTTKSVTPTAAGEELVQSVLQPFDTIEGALESLNRYRNTPTGRIRINAAVEAANLLLAPVMPAFMDRYLCPGWTAPSGAYGMVPTGGRFSYLLFKPPAIADRASPSD